MQNVNRILAAINGRSLGEIANRYRLDAAGGKLQRRDLFHKVTITSGTTQSVDIFNKQEPVDGIHVTNMQEPGKLPKGEHALVYGISALIVPGVSPAEFGAQAASKRANDLYHLAKQGVLSFTYKNNREWTLSPLADLCAVNDIGGSGAASDATTAGATMQGRLDLSHIQGKPYELDVPWFLEEQCTFGMRLDYSAAITMPSGQNASIIFKLHTLYFSKWSR